MGASSNGNSGSLIWPIVHMRAAKLSENAVPILPFTALVINCGAPRFGGMIMMSLKKVALFFLLVIAGFSLLLAGCSKNSTNYDIPTGMRSQVGGKAFLAIQYGGASYPYYYQIAGTGIINGDTVTITVYVATPVVVNQKISTDNTAQAEIDYEIRSNNIPSATYSAYQGQKGPAYYTVTALDTVKH